MTEKELRCSRYIENFNPPHIIEKLVHKVCESVADAFLGQIEYGKDYVIRTELAKENWANGFGTKYTYNLQFDELVRCRDCKHFTPKGTHKFENGKVNADYCDYVRGWVLQITSDGFCAWGERRERESAEVWNQWSADDVTCSEES